VTARELPEGQAGRETAAPAPPDDAQRLREEIERTRQHLGATVEQLAARADVKGRAQAKATELARQVTWQARSVGVQARKQAVHAGQQAVARAESVRGALTATTADTRQKAITSGQAAPAPVRQVAAKGADVARKRQVQLSAAGAAGLLAAIAFVIWQRRKR
jgi:hypothetical protein